MNTEVDKSRALKLGMIFLGLLSIFVFVKIIGEARAYRFIGSNPEIRSSITVSGTGEVFSAPDVAVFAFGGVAEAKSATAAEQAVVAKVKPALDYLKEKGIEEKDIKTISYNVYPKYETVGVVCVQYPCPPSSSRIAGYEASETIEVKIRNLDIAGEIISGVTDKGANSVSGLNFSIDDEDALTAEARKKAIEDAKSKALILAKDLGVKLVRITEFNENQNGGVYMKEYAAVDAMGSAAPAAVPLPSGENKIVSNVSITYEIR